MQFVVKRKRAPMIAGRKSKSEVCVIRICLQTRRRASGAMLLRKAIGTAIPFVLKAEATILHAPVLSTFGRIKYPTSCFCRPFAVQWPTEWIGKTGP
jgi:hypothetical protein